MIVPQMLHAVTQLAVLIVCLYIYRGNAYKLIFIPRNKTKHVMGSQSVCLSDEFTLLWVMM